MCFAVNQANKKALEALLDSWAPPAGLMWPEQVRVDAFAHPIRELVFNGPQGGSPYRAAGVWGLIPSWVRTEAEALNLRSKTLNARRETLFTLPSFRASAPTQRCLLPVNGFYEYQHLDRQGQPDPKGKRTQLYLLTCADHDAFFLGGLWSQWKGLLTFTLVTEPAGPLLSQIHNAKQRQPLLLSGNEAKTWLEGGSPVSTLEVQATAVSPGADLLL